MKIAVFLVSVLASYGALAFPISDGVFVGKGYFQMSNHTVRNHYKIRVENEQGKMLNIYEARGTSSILVTLDEEPDGSYSVSVQGVPDRGTGYCLADKKICHYEFVAGAMKVEETIVQTGDQLEKFGSKYDMTSPSVPRVSWYEDLKLISTPKEN